MRALIVLMLLSSTAMAEPTKLAGAAITTLLTDKTLYAKINDNDASQLFMKNGATFYSVGGAQTQGEWKVDGDKYCSVWPPNPTWVCYDVLQDETHVTFVSPSGKNSEFSTVQ